MILKFNVKEQTVSLVNTKSVPRIGSKDYLVLQFSFSSDWANLNKLVYLQNGDISQPIDIVDNLVEVPEWFTEQNSFNVTLFGTDGTTEVPTNVVSVQLEKSNDLWVKDAPEPTPSWIVKLIDLSNHPPIPGSNGFWMLWDVDKGEYVESKLALPSGGASSWNDLKDKPFYDESKTLLAWNGDTTGHETIEMFGTSFVYIGGSAIDPSVLIGATVTVTNGVDEQSTVINNDSIVEGFENVYIVAAGSYGFYLVTADNTTVTVENTSVTFPYAGVYVAPKESFDGLYVSSIVKTVIKKIDNKFLPTVCGKTADAEGNISLEASDVGAAKLFVVTETSYGVVDKSGEQIRDAYLAGNVVILAPKDDKIMYLLTVGKKGTFNPEGYKFFSVGISSDINIPYFRTATIIQNHVTYKTEDLARYESSWSNITLDSSTAGSTKRFNITVDDSGTISAKEI